MADIIGVSGSIPYNGIPLDTIIWGAPGNQSTASATGNSAFIFTQVKKSPSADKAVTRDNSNEIVAIKRSNKTWRLSFSAKLTAADAASALTKNQQKIPLIDDCVNISTADTQVSGYSYVESVDLGYTPDGDAVVDFVLTKYPNAFTAV